MLKSRTTKAALVGAFAAAVVMGAAAPGVAGDNPKAKKGPKSGGVMGFAWVDADADGARDAGEMRLAGVKVEVLDATGAVVAEATSRANGRYAIKKLAWGDYTVKVTAPAGYTVSAEQAAGLAVSLKKGDPKEKVQIPATAVPAS